MFAKFLLKLHIGTIARYLNAKDHGHKIFQHISCTETACIMVHQPLFHPKEEVHVPFDQLKLWKLTKMHPPEKCEGAKQDQHVPQHNPLVQADMQRSHVQKALLQACMDHAVTADQVAFTNHPNHVWSLQKMKKGALKFVPCGTVSKLKGEPVKDKIYIKAFGHDWQVQPYKAWSDFSKDGGVLSPFWWVKAAGQGEDGNMSASEIVVDACKIPILTNSSPVAAHDKLLTDNGKKEIQPKKKAKTES